MSFLSISYSDFHAYKVLIWLQILVVEFPVVEPPNVCLKLYQRTGIHLWLILRTSVICIIQLA